MTDPVIRLWFDEIITFPEQREVKQGLAEINVKLYAARLVVLHLRTLLIERIEGTRSI